MQKFACCDKPKSTSSGALTDHVSSCKIAPDSPTYTTENMLIKNKHVALDVKRSTNTSEYNFSSWSGAGRKVEPAQDSRIDVDMCRAPYPSMSISEYSLQ
jgi:hypothetical protein